MCDHNLSLTFVQYPNIKFMHWVKFRTHHINTTRFKNTISARKRNCRMLSIVLFHKIRCELRNMHLHLKLYLPDHVVEGLDLFGRLELLRSSANERFSVNTKRTIPFCITVLYIRSQRDAISRRHEYPKQKTGNSQNTIDNEKHSPTKTCLRLHCRSISCQSGLQSNSALRRKSFTNRARTRKDRRGGRKLVDMARNRNLTRIWHLF